MSTTNNFFKIEPFCIINGRLSYNLANSLLVYYNPVDKIWVLSSFNNTSDVFATLNNDNFFLPIENVNGVDQYNWNIIKTPPKEVYTLSGECPSMISYPNLCITIDCDQQEYIYDQNINSKPSWKSVSNPTSLIKYENSSWVLTNYKNYTIKSSSTQDVPLDGWTRLGGTSTITVVEGQCISNFDFTVATENPSCIDKNDGSITVSLNCSIPGETYFYSTDNIGFTTSNVFENLTPNTYNVCVKTASSPSVCKPNIVVSAGSAKTKYTLELKTGTQTGNLVGSNYTYYTPFELIVRDNTNQIITNLPSGTEIKFDLLIDDNFKLYEPTPPAAANEYSITLNGINIPINQFVPTTPTSVANIKSQCIGKEYITYDETRIYKITLTGNFSMSGFVKNIQSGLIPKDPSATCPDDNKLENSTIVQITNITNTCPCCEVDKIGQLSWSGCNSSCRTAINNIGPQVSPTPTPTPTGPTPTPSPTPTPTPTSNGTPCISLTSVLDNTEDDTCGNPVRIRRFTMKYLVNGLPFTPPSSISLQIQTSSIYYGPEVFPMTISPSNTIDEIDIIVRNSVYGVDCNDKVDTAVRTIGSQTITTPGYSLCSSGPTPTPTPTSGLINLRYETVNTPIENDDYSSLGGPPDGGCILHSCAPFNSFVTPNQFFVYVQQTSTQTLAPTGQFKKLRGIKYTGATAINVNITISFNTRIRFTQVPGGTNWTLSMLKGNGNTADSVFNTASNIFSITNPPILPTNAYNEPASISTSTTITLNTNDVIFIRATGGCCTIPPNLSDGISTIDWTDNTSIGFITIQQI
jgi:hypothetical protein